jgi:soluble lytic murein transglycosylase
MSQTARSTGNLMLERLYLSKILLTTDDGGTRYRLARNHFETGSYAEAIRLLTTKKGTPKGDLRNNMRREAEALLGEAYLRSGQAERARQIFTALIDRVPDAAQPDDAALAAARSLDVMDGETTLTEAEHMRRANVYQFNRDFAGARHHLETLLANYPTGPSAADAVFQIGRSHAQQGNYTEAVKWYERILEQHPTSAVAKDALLNAAAAYSRYGKSKEALTRYQTFIDRYPADEKLDRAYLNTVDILRDQGSDTDALKWSAATEGAFKGKIAEALAVFAAARIHIARDDWPKALETLDRLKAFPDLGASVAGGTSTAEVAFLRGYVLEQMKRHDEAIDVYLSIGDGRNEYYGWRATERLQRLAADADAAPFLAQKAAQFYAGLKAKDADTRRRSAQSLLRVTTSPEAREKALETLRQAIKTLPAYKAPAFKPASDEASHIRDIAAVEPLWRKVPADFPIDLMPKEQAAALYPAPYSDELLRYAATRGLDPRLMLAIMRQESRFQPDVKSVAAARGLMQFIAPTATQVANELGRDRFSQDDIYHAPTAVLFGSHYMAGLFERFRGKTEAVLASYNGGDDNVQRWLGRARSSAPERYVPELMFAQTKEYVERVMANYRMYQHLYDERLQMK